MSTPDRGGEPSEVADEVTSLELFFDLVFVFVITQLTSVIVAEPTWAGVARAVLMLSVVWWMYAGYAWLTNAVPPTTGRRRILVLLAMGGFFVVALAIPDAFGDTGVVLGLAYLWVVIVHLALFASAGGTQTESILRLAPFNLSAAACVLAAGFADGWLQYALWGAAVVIEVVGPFLAGGQSGFRDPAGALRGTPWAPGAHRARRVRDRRRCRRRGPRPDSEPDRLRAPRAGGRGCTVVDVLRPGGQPRRGGIAALTRRAAPVVGTVGVRLCPPGAAVRHRGAGSRDALRGGGPARRSCPASAAWFLGGGTALYLLGDVGVRRILHSGPIGLRLAAAAAALATVPVGRWVAAEAQTATLFVVLVALVLIERRGDQAVAADTA